MNYATPKTYPSTSYVTANQFLNDLRANKNYITKEQFSEMKLRALRGDIEGAYKQMYIILQPNVKCI